MRQKILSLSLIFALASCAFAQQKRAGESEPSVERLRAHVSFLASGKLEGRRTGSSGANAAAEYIAREFARYGLKRSIGRDLPGMSILEANSPRRYMQEFPFVAGVESGKNKAMFLSPRVATGASSASEGGGLTSLDLVSDEEWMPLGFSSNGHAQGSSVVFVGYGITAADLKYDDYAGVDVRGRIALALSGTPDGDNPHGEFARYADEHWKAIAAREHGAAALVVIAREENFKDDRLSRLRYDNSAGEAGLHVVAISRQVAGRILESGGLSPLAEMEKAARSTAPAGLEAGKSAGESRKSVAAPLLHNVTLTILVDIARRNAPAYNVVGILEGSDPVLKNEAIVIGAHYDHLGRGGSNSLATREGDIHYGADDNASGVAGVLELARIFSAERARMKRTLVFIAFSGEEEGLLGSNFYVNHPIWPLNQTVAMINMDMIGRMKEKKLMIGGVGTSQVWREMTAAANLARGMSVTAAGSGARKLYVGNLSFKTTGESLREYFSQAGTVESASIIEDRETGRSRGFGFVEMATAEEAAAAIEKFNGKELDGRNLTVNEARQNTDRDGGGGGGGGRGGDGRSGRGGRGSDDEPIVKSDQTKLFDLTLNEDGYGPSDHSSFYAKQVPVLFFFTGTHDDYHKPSDTAEKINYEDEARILSFVAAILRSVDAGASRPTYTTAKSQSQGRSMGFRVYLGTIPNYSEANDGLKLDGVREDSPAAKAGLKAGDRIVKIAGHEVRNVQEYTYALGEMKAGQEYEVEVVRGSETLKLKLTPTTRK